MKTSRLVLSTAAIASLLLAGCGGETTPPTSDGSAAPAAAGSGEASAAPADDFDALIAKAKEEGKVVWYTSVPSERAEQIGQMFKDKYGIEPIVHRSGGEDILQKFLLEEEAGRVQNDVLTITDPAAFINLKEKGVLTCFKPPNFDEVLDDAKDADGCWIASRVNAYVMAVNTSKVSELPKSFDDLTDSKYKGQISYVNPNFSSGSLIVTAALAKDKGWDWFEKFVKNDPFVVKGNNDTMQKVATGERPIATFVNSTYVADAKKEGQQVDWVFPSDGTYMVPAPSAVMKAAPNPSAGKLLAAFILTEEVQQLMIDDGNYGALKSLPVPEGQPELKDLKVPEIDYDAIAEEGNTVRDKFTAMLKK